jgi:Leucine-rich repeat (LRR) protein
MADGSAAEKAYQAALEEIEKVKAAGGTELDLSTDGFAALEDIPVEIRQITGLSSLLLDKTNVSDLSPLKELNALKNLRLAGTPVRDISALQHLTGLAVLDLSRSGLHDASPLGNLTELQYLYLGQTALLHKSLEGFIS